MSTPAHSSSQNAKPRFGTWFCGRVWLLTGECHLIDLCLSQSCFLMKARLWSLYLGRPTTIKTSDVAPSCLSFDFSRMILCRRSWQEKKSTTRIYEALLRMMEIVSQLCDLRGPRPSKNAELYYKLAAIDQQLRDWRSSLPKHLKWSTELHTAMPAPYYLLQ
jgi:hypothetical protein